MVKLSCHVNLINIRQIRTGLFRLLKILGQRWHGFFFVEIVFVKLEHLELNLPPEELVILKAVQYGPQPEGRIIGQVRGCIRSFDLAQRVDHFRRAPVGSVPGAEKQQPATEFPASGSGAVVPTFRSTE